MLANFALFKILYII